MSEDWGGQESTLVFHSCPKILNRTPVISPDQQDIFVVRCKKLIKSYQAGGAATKRA